MKIIDEVIQDDTVDLDRFFTVIRANYKQAEYAHAKICAAMKTATPTEKLKLQMKKAQIEEYLDFFAPTKKVFPLINKNKGETQNENIPN